MACTTGVKQYLNPNSNLILSIGASTHPDAGYDIKFVAVDYDSQVSVKPTDFSPFMKDGERLSITPQNSPLVLTVPGLYLFERLNQQRADLFVNEVRVGTARGSNT